MFPFYIPWKHHKTFGSLGISESYKMGTLAKNGFICYVCKAALNEIAADQYNVSTDKFEYAQTRI